MTKLWFTTVLGAITQVEAPSLEIRYTKEPDVNPLWIDDWDSEIRQTLPFAIDIFLELEVQPRRSLESLNILGANRARLEFNEVFHFPERTRFRFRNRIYSTQPGAAADEAAGAADAAGTAAKDGATEGLDESAGGSSVGSGDGASGSTRGG